jgi:predicted glycoside hydrolase/deacetylase ChbG (UPF0249 family)
MAQDKMIIEILDDGTIKTTTDPISQPNHESAAQFVKTIARLADGVETVTKRQKQGHQFTGHSHGNKQNQ